jgi:N-acyl-D-amino-acid deacylase
MDDARARGHDITADVFPYNNWQSGITDLMPPKVDAGGDNQRRDVSDRAGWEKGLAEIGGAKNVLLSNYEAKPEWQGKTIAELAATTGKDAVSVIQEIVQNGGGSVVVTAMQERDVRAFIAHPRIMFCTDGGLRGTHPRGAGSFPRILGKYVREDRVLPLEQAIRKATSLPAWRMGFKDRGAIAPGKKADLVLFDPRTVRDTATTKDPRSAPVGLTDVLVNGTPVLRDGRLTGERPGRVLRRSAG